jgi:hypothetical protein
MKDADRYDRPVFGLAVPPAVGGGEVDLVGVS